VPCRHGNHARIHRRTRSRGGHTRDGAYDVFRACSLTGVVRRLSARRRSSSCSGTRLHWAPANVPRGRPISRSARVGRFSWPCRMRAPVRFMQRSCSAGSALTIQRWEHRHEEKMVGDDEYVARRRWSVRRIPGGGYPPRRQVGRRCDGIFGHTHRRQWIPFDGNVEGPACAVGPSITWRQSVLRRPCGRRAWHRGMSRMGSEPSARPLSSRQNSTATPSTRRRQHRRGRRIRLRPKLLSCAAGRRLVALIKNGIAVRWLPRRCCPSMHRLAS
jgi:hypothetical protein